MTALRIGLLGAARISDLALVTPALDAGHRLVAVAARDPERARAWADERQVERVVPSYVDLVNDPEVDVVYNPLPNSLHAPWNIAVIEAGKHLLSEKPFASNAIEAEQVRDVAGRATSVVFEGFHYRYHPIFERLLQVTADGTIGDLERLRVTMSMPAPGDDDLRWSWPLSGGALMDLGCYAIHVIRSVAERHGGTPELVSAEAVERAGRPQIDESAHLEFRLPQEVAAVATVTWTVRGSSASRPPAPVAARDRELRQRPPGRPPDGADDHGRVGGAPRTPQHVPLPDGRPGRGGHRGTGLPDRRRRRDRQHADDRRVLRRRGSPAPPGRLVPSRGPISR